MTLRAHIPPGVPGSYGSSCATRILYNVIDSPGLRFLCIPEIRWIVILRQVICSYLGMFVWRIRYPHDTGSLIPSILYRSPPLAFHHLSDHRLPTRWLSHLFSQSIGRSSGASTLQTWRLKIHCREVSSVSMFGSTCGIAIMMLINW